MELGIGRLDYWERKSLEVLPSQNLRVRIPKVPVDPGLKFSAHPESVVVACVSPLFGRVALAASLQRRDSFGD